MESNYKDEDILYTLAFECESMLIDLHEALEKADSTTTVREIHTEFQQRFAAWTAHLGVFARKSQCLDTRLRNFPDLQDLTVRLLDILRRCLYQWKSATDCPLEEQLEHVQMTLQGIDDTLTRLNNLGVTIRQSSANNIDSKAMQMTMGTDLDVFENLCMQTVRASYPRASEALKDLLIRSMKMRWGRIKHFSKRQQELSNRREPRPPLETIPETPTTTIQTAPKPARPLDNTSSLVTDDPKPSSAPPATLAQSSLSSVNIQHIMHRSRAPDEVSTRIAKTLSVQGKQSNYPKPPDYDGGGSYFTCQWCSELIDKKTLTDNAWQQHIERDLRPYICLFDGCAVANKSFPSFSEWFEHMQQLHGRRWHQKLYLKPSWVCTVCQSDYQAYDTPQALHSHLQQSHDSEFTKSQLQIMSRLGKIEQQRAWNDCLLCSLAVDIENTEGHEPGEKRRKGQMAHDANKSARTSLATSSAGPHGQSSRGSDTTLDSDSDSDSDLISMSEINEPADVKYRSRTVARHIAGHLQTLMLLTLRFATLTNNPAADDNEVNSDSVEVDEGDSTAGGNLEKATTADLDVEMDREGPADEPLGLDEDIRDDSFTIPDCDIEVNIPTRYDDFKAEDDEFIQGVIESGAFQAWDDVLDGNDEKPLGELLRACAVEHADCDQHFWGYATLKEVMARRRVMKELLRAERGNFGPREAAKLCQNILPVLPTEHHRGRQVPGYQPTYLAIFALLALTGTTKDIDYFLLPELSDGRILFADPGVIQRCIDGCGWDYGQRDTFQLHRRGVMIPYFDTGKDGVVEVSPHLNLPENTLLPWLKVEGNTKGTTRTTWADLGAATRRMIDPNSHNFKRLLDPVGLDCDFVAVSSIDLGRLPDKTAFHNMVDILKRLGAEARRTSVSAYRHMNILLGTCNVGDNYHLIFPAADSDLDDYLKMRTSPLNITPSSKDPAVYATVDTANALWLSEQIVGLMDCVNFVHNFSRNSGVKLTEAVEYFRPGRLSPPNILWLTSMTNERGILAIGDPRLAALYTELEPSDEIMHITMAAYAVPECHTVDAATSSASDIWSLACVFLRIAAWALGEDETRFSMERIKDSFLAATNSFFEITRRADGKFSFFVKSVVAEHIAKLHCMPGCTQYIHDLLDLISGSMLRIRPENRATAKELLQTLGEMNKRGCVNPSYVTNTQPMARGLGNNIQEKWTVNGLHPGILKTWKEAIKLALLDMEQEDVSQDDT